MENNFHLMKFYCPVCNKVEVGQVMDLQKADGIMQSIMCSGCGNIMSLALLDSFLQKLNEVANGEISIESMMYNPTKIAQDGREYDMQPRSKR